MHWTLKDTQTIQLHPQFVWVDEFDWQASVSSEPIYTLTGAMIIETGIKKAGRPITLKGDDVWLDKALLVKLFDLQGKTLTLGVPDGRIFDVLLKKLTNVAPITRYQKADETDTDQWRCDILMMTV